VEHKKTAVVVYEDDDILVFMDKAPFNLGHTLVMPKKHYRYLTDMSENEVSSLFRVVSRVAKAVLQATGADGLNIGQSNGEAASQTIPHVHVHIIPRFKNDAEQGAMFPPRKHINVKGLRESGRLVEEALNSFRD
jgi:diadenosine tetraphosphate (Ap4A) HIT family hydrolase